MATQTTSLIQARVAMRFIPKGSTLIEGPMVGSGPGGPSYPLGVCYVGQELNGPRQLPIYTVLAYIGTAGKRCFYESYRTAEARDKRVAEFFAGLEQTAAMRAGWKAEREKPHTVKVGDIIHHSWGYDQTQCDFYQVLAVTAHGATIQAIASEPIEGSAGFMSDRRVPVRDHFVRRCGSGPVEEPLKVRISGQNYVTTLEHGSAGVWDGSPKYCSWYA